MSRRIASKGPRMNGAALWIWGRCRDFEREQYAKKAPAQLLAGMTDTMHADMARIVPEMAAYFEQFAAVLKELSGGEDE